jgi:hypothetical protein
VRYLHLSSDSNSQQFRLPIPQIYCYVGNRLTQYIKSAKAFRTVVNEIGDEIWAVWQRNPNIFDVHPTGTGSPKNRAGFNVMFQYEIVDANTASVVSSSLGIPIVRLNAGQHQVAGKRVTVNQTQLQNQQPNIQSLVAAIESCARTNYRKARLLTFKTLATPQFDHLAADAWQINASLCARQYPSPAPIAAS